MVIGTNLSEFRNVWLDQGPIKRITSTNNHYRRASAADAIEMNSVAANINQFSDWGMILTIGRR
jgi:hypothetical protein